MLILSSVSCKEATQEINSWARKNSLRGPQGEPEIKSKISSVCPRGSITNAKLSSESKKMCQTNSGTIFPAADAFQEYYANGNPKTLLVYSGDNLLRVNWYEDGKQKEEIQYQKNHKEGVFRSWHQTGNIKEIGNYSAGKKNGVFKYYNEQGKITEKSVYKLNQKEGISEKYNENGKLLSRLTFVNGTKHGNAEFLHADIGVLSSHGTFQNGFYTGRWINYNKNGTRSSFGSYNDKGEKHGEWKYFDEKGKPSHAEYFANGEVGKKFQLQASVPFNSSDQIGAKPPELRPENRYKANIQPTLAPQEKKGWQPL